MARYKGAKKPQAAKRPPLTHFLCVPLVTPTSKKSLEVSLGQFSNGVTQQDRNILDTKDPEARTASNKDLQVIHPRTVRPVGALHLTLGVMSLNNEKLTEATDYLTGVDVHDLIERTTHSSAKALKSVSQMHTSDEAPAIERELTPPVTEQDEGPLEIRLQGVQSMHAAHKTSILYVAPTDATDRLYPFCVALQKLFRDEGFLVEDSRPLKLHATVVNTIYAKPRKQQTRSKNDARTSENTELPKDTTAGDRVPNDDNAGSSNRGINAGASSRTIDATAILEAYKDFVWADRIVLDRISICEMGAEKVFDNEGKEIGAEYTEVASVSLPT